MSLSVNKGNSSENSKNLVLVWNCTNCYMVCCKRQNKELEKRIHWFWWQASLVSCFMCPVMEDFAANFHQNNGSFTFLSAVNSISNLILCQSLDFHSNFVVARNKASFFTSFCKLSYSWKLFREPLTSTLHFSYTPSSFLLFHSTA